VDRFEHGMVVRDRGDGCRGTLLWIHGLGESGLCFEPVLGRPELAGCRHLVPDLPGYGRSPWPEEPLSLEATARHLAAWLRHRGGDAVTVVGHSMGGVVATMMAELEPDLVRAVVNVDGNVSLGDCTFSGQAAVEEEGAFVTTAFSALRDRVLSGAGDDAALLGYYVSLRLADPRTFHRHSLELVAQSRNEALGRRMRDLRASVLYVAGAPRGASPRSLELLAEAGVPVIVVSPAGHWPFVDLPAEFAEALARHLEEEP
jgi:pimeloyl-ACP methyl ester carboxylesterase